MYNKEDFGFDIDNRFISYFNNNLHQVFLYITDKCQLQCEQCLYKTTLSNREMDYETLIRLLGLFRKYGAKKLTLLGGEPTLYGYQQNWVPLFNIISYAKEIGYEYIRLDTNGQFDIKLLDNDTFKKINNLAFSFDGHNAEINDALRGKGTFKKALIRIKRAIDLEYYVTITSCVHPQNINKIDKMISFAIEIGALELNFHPLFKMGIERDNFSGNAHIEPEQWIKIYDKYHKKIISGQYPISIRLPKRFVSKDKYYNDLEKYSYCPVKMGERILIHPDGTMRICALCIGSRYHIAEYTKNKISFCYSNNSEINNERLANLPCMSQTRDFGNHIPLCISYKPHQKEYVWLNEKFDNKFV